MKQFNFYLCFSDNYPNGIIMRQDALKKLIGYRTIVPIDAELIKDVNKIIQEV